MRGLPKPFPVNSQGAQVDFRCNRITRLAYLTLKCLTLVSLIWIAFSIHLSWGIPVLIAFGILAVSLIYLYRDKIKIRQLVTR